MQCELSAGRALAMAAAVATATMFGAASASAGDKTVLDGFMGAPQFSVNATVTSDYRYRGFSQTQEKGALQGGFDVIWPNLYMGLWASTVNFGGVSGDSVEVVPYVGYKRKLLGGDLDLRATYFVYPGAGGEFNIVKGLDKDLDYFEAMVGFSREIHQGLTLDSRVFFSPNYQGGTGRNVVLESGLTRKLETWGRVTPSVSAKLGSSMGDESNGGFDYYYWNAGMSFVFANYFELDLRYYDTFDVPTAALGAAGCRNLCDGRFVARLTFEN